MEQNEDQTTYGLSRDMNPPGSSFQEIEHYLTSLCQQLSDNTEACKHAQQFLAILEEMRHIQKDLVRKQEEIENLKYAFHDHFQTLKTFLVNTMGKEPAGFAPIIHKLESCLSENIFRNRGTPIKVIENSCLQSMGFGQIVRMINDTSVHEPEWMSRTGTLLVLDNNPNTSQALARRLTREGHIVLSAEDAPQAFEYLRAYSVEALLVDYSVFKIGLPDFLKAIEQDPGIGYVPVIVVGAPENAEVLEKMAESGVGDYIAKPVNTALLKIRVHAVLEKKYAFEQRLKRSRELQRTRHDLETAIQKLSDGFAIFDQEGHLVMHNDKLFDFYPHLKKQEEMLRSGLTFEKILEANIAAGLYHFETPEKSRQWLEEKRANFSLPAYQWEESLPNGLILSVMTYRTPDGGGVLVVKDVSQDKAQRQNLTFMAYHDSLTGLPNRKVFYQELAKSILEVKRSGKGLLAVLFLDLDGFKVVNDSYGHEMGDWLLVQVSQRLRRCIRANDVLARFGGDEFCIILNHASNRSKIKAIAARILKSISEPYIREEVALHVGASIGIGLYSLEMEDDESVVKEADAAMYAVKQEGKGQFRFYDEMGGFQSP